MIKSSSSSHSQDEHLSPILPPLSSVSFPCVSILIAWPLTFSLCLPMSFSISLPLSPSLFWNNHCSVYGAHQGWAIRSALRLSCLFVLIQCVSFTLSRQSPAVFTGTKRTMLTDYKFTIGSRLCACLWVCLSSCPCVKHARRSEPQATGVWVHPSVTLHAQSPSSDDSSNSLLFVSCRVKVSQKCPD